MLLASENLAPKTWHVLALTNKQNNAKALHIVTSHAELRQISTKLAEHTTALNVPSSTQRVSMQQLLSALEKAVLDKGPRRQSRASSNFLKPIV